MELKKKYNLLTAIAMVVGIVIGSGVFFKASGILEATGGNMWLSILAWVLGGLVMIISAYTFSLVAANTKTSGDLIDLADETVGRKQAYTIAWYYSIIYYPMLAAVLCWVSSNFIGTLVGNNSPAFVIPIAIVILCILFTMNYIAPKIAGYFQVSVTFIKLVPLVIMAVVGTIYGLFFNDGMLLENFTVTIENTGLNGFMSALCATCFAYEGWICATSIGKELKNPKKNLPIALVLGTIIILCVYIIYYIGLAGTFPNSDFITNEEQVKLAFQLIFGKSGGVVLYVFVILSCIGTTNGVLMGTLRGFSSIASTNNGPKPELFKKINKYNTNGYSSLIGIILVLIWMVIWFFLVYIGFDSGSVFAIDVSELVIIFVYLAYIPIYISIIKTRSDLNKFNRYVMPSLAIFSSLFMLVAAIISHEWGCLIFMVITILAIALGLKFYKPKKEENESIN